MREQVQIRLEMLRKEYEKGQVELQRVERQRTYVHETVLRIGGAIQVLEELLGEEQPDEHSEADSGETQPAVTIANGDDGKQTETPFLKEKDYALGTYWQQRDQPEQ